MKKLIPLLFTLMSLTRCDLLDMLKPGEPKDQNTEDNNQLVNDHEGDNDTHQDDQIISYDDYGAFLGRSENNIQGFDNYNYISLELDEYTDQVIQNLNNSGKKLFAYLNVGSLEEYRDYYDQFENITIGEYENWEDEKWLDITNSTWQNYVINTLAKGFKNRGAFGVYMDNVDVYSIAKEEHLNSSAYAVALKNIIKGVSDLGLKVMLNGGAEFLDDMNNQNDNIFNSIWGYHQEEVFSLIEDYDNNIFGVQDSEDSSYYKEILTLMKNKNKNLFILEYTTNQTLKEQIKQYCEINNIHFYISSDIDLI